MRKRTGIAAAIIVVFATGEALTASKQKAAPAHSMNTLYAEMKWQRMMPDLKEMSPEITILREDPVTRATQLIIRMPKGLHVPMHWHSSNETHTVVQGTFIMECEGKREALKQGSFNYVPARMHHEAWTSPDEGALLFITVDKGWDVNWVAGPPKPSDFLTPAKS